MEFERQKIINICFDQAGQCLVVATTNGFQYIQLRDGASMRKTQRFEKGGLAIAWPMYNAQYLSIVGSSVNTQFPSTRVFIWDDQQSTTISDITFRSEVRNVMMRSSWLIVILSHGTYIYNIRSLTPCEYFQTFPNDNGIGDMSTDSNQLLLVLPGQVQGHVTTKNFQTGSTGDLQLHESIISAIKVNASGSLAATSNGLGTIIRVFDCQKLVILHELRRGTSVAQISNIAFSPDNQILVCASDHETIHLWQLGSQSSGMLGFVRSALPKALSAVRSAGKLSLSTMATRLSPLSRLWGPLVSFENERSFFVVGLDGTISRCEWDSYGSVIRISGQIPWSDF